MLGLVKNDLYLSKKYLLIYFFSTLLFLFIYVYIKKFLFSIEMEETSFTLLAFPFIFTMLSITFFGRSFDIHHFYLATPVSHRQFVFSKYLYSLMYIGFGLLIGYLTLTVLLIADNTEITFSPYKTLFILAMCLLIYTTFEIPLLIIIQNDTICFMIPLCVIIAICVVTIIATGYSPFELYSKLVSFYYEHTFISEHLWALMILIYGICFGISSTISSRLLSRKEF